MAWGELLPFLGICVGVVSTVQYLHMPFTFLTQKGAFRPVRYSRNRFDNATFERDCGLTGGLYRQQGLETIDDE